MSMNGESSLAISRRFAAALDRCDFAQATGYLAADCRYEIGGKALNGRDAIIASYRESAEWGRRMLDGVVYESDVRSEGDHFAVLYTDRITHGGETCEYRSRQHLWLNADGQVMKIVHEELSGEREKLNGFFARHGVKR